jgi:hypothetical protein
MRIKKMPFQKHKFPELEHKIAVHGHPCESITTAGRRTLPSASIPNILALGKFEGTVNTLDILANEVSWLELIH